MDELLVIKLHFRKPQFYEEWCFSSTFLWLQRMLFSKRIGEKFDTSNAPQVSTIGWWKCFRIPAHVHLQAERSECGGTRQVSWPWIWILIWILQNIFHLRCEFEIGVEADDADVSWYRYQLSPFPIYSTSVNGDKEYTYCTHVSSVHTAQHWYTEWSNPNHMWIME